MIYYQQCVRDKSHRFELECDPSESRPKSAICCAEPVRIIIRKDHAFERGYMGVCPRCGEDREDHDR